jgi:hypothetical protein
MMRVPLTSLAFFLNLSGINAFQTIAKNRNVRKNTCFAATAVPTSAASESSTHGNLILDQISSGQEAAREYAEMFGFGETEASLYNLFDAMRKSGLALGLKGLPYVLRKDEIVKAIGGNGEKTLFDGFFTISDLEKALEDDFLDASRGSTDNRKGWKIAAVSNPRGDSFEEARMRYEDVQVALEKGTVIFNAAGAHIPKLAGPCLAVTDATSTPNAVNLYVTAAGKRTSAPPHTDKQDVVVIQTSGKKAWRVYKPTDPSLKPMADLFARGKGDDNLPLYTLDENGDLLIETTLSAGDVLFVPAGFPHTTGTAFDASEEDDTSLHLTFNIDTHVWDLDYLSARRMALRRACVQDIAMGQSQEEDNRYVGRVNELPKELHEEMFSELPLGFLDEMPAEDDASIAAVTEKLMRIAKEVDAETFSQVNQSVWKETVKTLKKQGVELFDIHRDMYIAAMEEGRNREAEDAMTAHLDQPKRKALTPERMQRLSLFRVQRYYESINKCKSDLVEWSYAGKPSASSKASTGLSENWAFTMPIKVGDQVEADLGGAFFPATVSRVVGNTYDVKFFDGDQESGLDRSMLKLLAPPNLAEAAVDTSKMTPKQLKRWKKQQQNK